MRASNRPARRLVSRARWLGLLALFACQLGCEYYVAYKVLGGGRSMRWHPSGPAVPSQAPAQLAPPPPGTEVAADLLEKSDGTRWLRVSASRASSVLTFRRVCDEPPIALLTGQPPRVAQGAELLLPVPPAAPPAPGEPTCQPARQRLFVFAVSRPPMLEGILLHCKSSEELLAELRAQRGPDVGAVELEEPPRP